MKLFKVIDNILAGFGNVRAMERNHIDTFTENLIRSVKGDKIAQSDYGQIYVSFQELAGYTFLNTTIISATNIKTNKGAQLIIVNNDSEKSISSDTKEIESDFSNVSNRWITKVNFIIYDNDIVIIKNKQFEALHFEYKNKSLKLNKL